MASVDHEERIAVEVAYARADSQIIVGLELDDGATAREAIETSGILKRYPDIDLGVNAVGVFGKPITLERLLRNGDRVEIYRPLQADPKESRRYRAALARGIKPRDCGR